MNICSIPGCVNRDKSQSGAPIQYHRLPKHSKVSQQWFSACWISDPLNNFDVRICSIHFSSDDYTSEYKYDDSLGCYAPVLKIDAIPTLNLTITNPGNFIAKLSSADDEPVTLSTIGLKSPDDILQYQIDPTNSTDTDKCIEIVPDEIAEPIENLENCSYNYKSLNHTELLSLQQRNEDLRKNIQQCEACIGNIEKNLKLKTDLHNEKEIELKKLFSEYDYLRKKGMSSMDQTNILSKVFSESQIKILSGKKKIYWSNDDMAVGYTIRHLSNKRCYMYLSKNLNIPLPALSSIKRWSTVKREEYEKGGKRDLMEFKNDDDDISE